MAIRSYPAVSAGGAAPDPVTLSSYGSATAISATNWSANNRDIVSLAAGSCAIWVKMSATLLVYVFRAGSDNKVYAGGFELDGSGDLSTVRNAQDLSADLPTSAKCPCVAVRISDTRIVIAAGTNGTSPTEFHFATYDYSAGTFTKSGSTQVHAQASGNNSALHGFGMVKYDDDHVFCMSNDNTSSHWYQYCWVVKFTATQAIGAVSNNGASSHSQFAGNNLVKCALSGNVFTYAGAQIHEWSVNTGTRALTLENTYGQISENWAAQINCDSAITQLTTPTENGQGIGIASGNIAWFQGATSDKAVSNWVSLGSFGGYTAPQNQNCQIVKIDESGNWVRGVFVANNGTTGMMAIPFAMDLTTGGVNFGPESLTTNITPWTTTYVGFGALYDPAWSHIWVFCEDTGAAPSYMQLQITT